MWFDNATTRFLPFFSSQALEPVNLSDPDVSADEIEKRQVGCAKRLGLGLGLAGNVSIFAQISPTF